MASARRTGTNENISTYHSAGTGSPDYTSLSTWESATDNDLVTGTVSEVLECAAGTHTDTISMVGATTNATYFRIIRANSSSHHGGVRAAGVIFSSTTDGHMFILADDYFSLQDVCLTQSINSSNSRDILQLSSAGDAADVVGCVIYGSSNAGAGHIRPITNGGTAGTKIIDTIIEGNTTGLACITNNQASGTPLLLSNVTISGGTTGVSAVTANLTKCVNVLCTGQTTCFSGTYTSSGSSNNASSDATAPGTSSRTTQTFTFLDTNDYHLSPSDAGAVGYGVDPSTYDDDIDRETVVTWNIGADGFASSGSAPVLTVPGAQSATFGSTKTITGVSFTDADSDVSQIDASCESGMTITFDLTGTSVTPTDNGTNVVSLAGTNADLATVLAAGIDVDRAEAWPTYEDSNTLTITLTDDGTNTDQNTITVNWTPPTARYQDLTGTPAAIITALQALDWTGTASGNIRMVSITSVPLSDTDDFVVTVEGESPVVSAPNTQFAAYGTPKTISGVSVSHADSSTISLLFECPAAMTMDFDAGATGATITGDESNSVLIEDTTEADLTTVAGSLIVSRATPATPVPSDLVPNSVGVSYTIESNLQVSDLVWNDRAFVFLGIPAFLRGATWIKTPNDDKASSAADCLVFTLNAPAWVYITLDSRYIETLPKPAWMDDWEFVDELIQIDVDGSIDYELYRKSFPSGAGSVTIGGYDFATFYSHWVAIILPIEATIPIIVTATDSNGNKDIESFNVAWSATGAASGGDLPLLASTRSLADVIL